MMDGTGKMYTVTDGDDGKAITVRVTFTDDAGYTEVLTSAPRTVSPNDPATGMPSITGFTGGNGTPQGRRHADGDHHRHRGCQWPGCPATMFTYEWRTNPTTK